MRNTTNHNTNVFFTLFVSLVDTVYEGAMKRTFLSAIPMAIVHIPFLIGIIVLYQKLGPNLKNLVYNRVTSLDKKQQSD